MEELIWRTGSQRKFSATNFHKQLVKDIIADQRRAGQWTKHIWTSETLARICFFMWEVINGKFGAVFASIPAPIFAALYCLFFAYVGSVGISFLQFCNLNSFRTKFILGFSFFMGLSVPQYFNEYTSVAGYGPVHTRSRWFNDIVNVIFSSKPFVAGFVAFFLDNTLHRDVSSTRKDRGYHWWDKFRSFKKDPRSEEFYSLPFNLNKFFPSV